MFWSIPRAFYIVNPSTQTPCLGHETLWNRNPCLFFSILAVVEEVPMSHLSCALEKFSPDDPRKAKSLFYKEPHKYFSPRWEFQDKENINQQNCEMKAAKMSKFLIFFLFDFFFSLFNWMCCRIECLYLFLETDLLKKGEGKKKGNRPFSQYFQKF